MILARSFFTSALFRKTEELVVALAALTPAHQAQAPEQKAFEGQRYCAPPAPEPTLPARYCL